MSSAREEWISTKASASRFYRGVLKKPEPDSSDDEDGGDGASQGETISTLPDYCYRESLRADSVRLLELLPGERRSPIVCHLQVHLLDALPNYEALSYVWGSSKDLEHIVVDGFGFQVTPRLHCALSNLRYSDRPRRLWVDAICISQSDDPERNAQVPLMREVYRNAASTICFLGPKRNTTHEMFAMLEDLAQEAKNTQTQESAHEQFDTVPAFMNHITIRPTESKLREKYRGDVYVIAIAACDWWHRAWTAQEILLSNHAIFMVGRRTMVWKTVCQAVDHGMNIQIWSPVSFGFIIDRSIVPYFSMRALMSRRRLQSSEAGSSSASELLHLLVHCRHRASTDPRDKIYAVLGLLRDTHSQVLALKDKDSLDIKLDYSHPVVYVYRKIAQTLIANLNNLDVLGISPKSDRRALPSWATDWSVTGPIGSPLSQDALDRQRKSHATKGSVASACFPEDGVTMLLSGYELSTLEELTDIFPNFEHNSPENLAYYTTGPKDGWLTGISLGVKAEHELFRQLMAIYGAIFEWARFSGKMPPNNTTDDPNTIFWQTLCAGTYSRGGVEETGALFQAWFDNLRPIGDFIEKHPTAHGRVPEIAFAKLLYNTWDSYGEFWPYVACAQHRRMGRAANGWLCLLPENSRVGDSIILASGGRVPLIVRATDDGYYTFIGEAYIHGIMDGEAYDAEACRDVRIC